MTEPLPANQRSLLFLLGVGAYAEQTGSDAETACEALDTYPMVIEHDRHDVVLEVAGRVLVRAPRAWLADPDGYRV